MRRRRTALIAAALSLVPVSAYAAPDPKLTRELAQLARDDARLQSIGWRLAKANLPFCRDRQLGSGLLLYDVAAFGNSAKVREALGFAGDIGVGAVAEGSPAARAGLGYEDELIGIGGVSLEGLNLPPKGDSARATSLQDRIDAALAAQSRVILRVRRPGQYARDVSLGGESVCRSRFELLTGGAKARADGKLVQVSRSVLAEQSDDAEAAALVGHELAHNLLGHRRRLDAVGRNIRTVLDTEREADRLSPWLLANAGYDPAAAVRFMQSWGPRHGGGLLRTPDHDGWKDRAALIAAELPRIAAARRARPGGPIDWRPYFEVTP